MFCQNLCNLYIYKFMLGGKKVGNVFMKAWKLAELKGGKVPYHFKGNGENLGGVQQGDDYDFQKRSKCH